MRLSADVMAELWSKLMVNCAYNAISGIAQAAYGQLAALAEVRALQEAVVREVVALAEAEGVNLPLALVRAELGGEATGPTAVHQAEVYALGVRALVFGDLLHRDAVHRRCRQAVQVVAPLEGLDEGGVV